MKKENILREYLMDTVWKHETLEGAVKELLVKQLNAQGNDGMQLDSLMACCTYKEEFGEIVTKDLKATVERDPACSTLLDAFLNYKGFWALTAHRISHHLWTEGREYAAFMIRNRVVDRWAIDIHPAAKIGSGVFIDHGTGLVIGETAIVEDSVSLFHEVTLGGTGKKKGDRHPKVRFGAMIGAGAKVLGNIEIGKHSRIGAGSIVIHSVPENTTVVGIPARIVLTNETLIKEEKKRKITEGRR